MKVLKLISGLAGVVLSASGAYADTLGALTLNYETTSSGTTQNSNVANSLSVPGSYKFGHSVAYTTGNVAGTTSGFYDDYIFTIPAGQVDAITSSIDLSGILGISNLQVRLFSVTDASAPGTTGNPGSFLLEKWSDVLSCGSNCNYTVNVLPPYPLTAGTYDLQVRGTAEASGGSFAGVLNTAPVPLPAAIVLLLSGLGVVGGIRRK
jgi:hypothetical protein